VLVTPTSQVRASTKFLLANVLNNKVGILGVSNGKTLISNFVKIRLEVLELKQAEGHDHPCMHVNITNSEANESAKQLKPHLENKHTPHFTETHLPTLVVDVWVGVLLHIEVVYSQSSVN
jgi:hypothetical protein